MDTATTTSPIEHIQSRMLTQNQQQLFKPQPQLTAQEITNNETVHKTIKRYQNKISEMIKIIQKQKKHNETLKNQLKVLNDNLNHMIEKINIKTNKKQTQNGNKQKQQETHKKNLQIQIKKNILMKKQLDTLRTKVKVFQSQKITQIQDQIRQKDKIIQQQNNKIKLYEKIQKQQMNMDIYKKYNEANEKINSLNTQLIHLKKKLTESKKIQEQQQKSIKRQHQQLLSLDVNKGNKNNQMIKKQQQKMEQSNMNSQINKLKQKIQTIETSKKAIEKSLKIQIQSLKNKNKILTEQLQQTKIKLSRKDKQSHILVSKMKQISRRSVPLLQPISMSNENTKIRQKLQQYNNNFNNNIKIGNDYNNLKIGTIPSSSLFDHRKQLKGLSYTHSQNITKFDDSQKIYSTISTQKSYRIKSLSFTYFQEHILSLTSLYQFPQSSTLSQSVKSISSFNLPHTYKNIKSSTLQLTQFQYIKQLQIYCSKFIQFIRIKTSRQNYLQVGNQKNTTKCKKYNFQIRTNEKPISILGVIETKKSNLNQGNKDYLIALGLEIKRKDVFVGKNKTGKSISSRQESLSLSRKLQQQNSNNKKESVNEINDKNIINNKEKQQQEKYQQEYQQQ